MPEITSSAKHRSYGAAYLGNAILLLSNLLALHLFARLFGSDGFAICAIARRNISIIALFVLPALSIALTRLTAQYSESKPENSATLLMLGQASLLSCLCPIVLVCTYFPMEFTRLSFGNTANHDLALPIALNVCGLTLLGLACAALNGRLRIVLSTFLSVSGLAILPLVVFALQPGSPAEYFWLLAQLLIPYSAIANLIVLRFFWQSRPNFSRSGKLAKEFTTFALPRVPQALGINLFTTLPLILVSLETDDPGTLAVIALSNFPITLGGLLVSPIATILLPETTQLVQRGGINKLSKQVRKGVLATVGALGLIIPIASLAVKPLLVTLIDPKLAESSHLLIWFIVAMLPICLYRIFSSVLDALSPKAYNTHNIIWSILALLIAYLLLGKIDGTFAVVASFLLGSCALGGLTLLRLRRLLEETEHLVVKQD